MGYFANGTEGELYEAEYCNRCVHQDDPCAVWLLHLAYNYSGIDDKSMSHALDMLIPRNGVHNDECAMFHEKQTASADDPLAYLEKTHGATK